MKTIWIKVAALLVVITLLSAGITCLTAAPRPASPEMNELQLVTGFYPAYIAALNVAGDIDGVTVTNLVNDRAGCLHDYQLSPADRALLQEADILILNGAGAEAFLDGALAALPNLPIINLSAGQSLLYGGHEHHHDDDDHDHDELSANPHVWMSPARYQKQVETLLDGLCELDPAHADDYRQNAEEYLAKINDIAVRLTGAVASLDGCGVVVFHDSLDYLATDLPLNILATLDIGEDSGASAGALSAAEDALRGRQAALFLYDAQYDTVTYEYLQTIPESAREIHVDTCVSGMAEADRWIQAMTALVDTLEETTA